MPSVISSVVEKSILFIPVDLPLLDYFGEPDVKECGCCDVCLAKNDQGISRYEFNRIGEALIAKVEEGDMLMKDLVAAIPYHEKKVIPVLRFLFDNHKLVYLHDGTVFLGREEN